MTREDIKIGNYYFGEWNDYGNSGSVIVKMEHSSLYNPNPHVCKDGMFDRSECLTAGDINFREATQEEIFWLDECIRQGKSIPKEYVDFTRMKKELNYEIY